MSGTPDFIIHNSIGLIVYVKGFMYNETFRDRKEKEVAC